VLRENKTEPQILERLAGELESPVEEVSKLEPQVGDVSKLALESWVLDRLAGDGLFQHDTESKVLEVP